MRRRDPQNRGLGLIDLATNVAGFISSVFPQTVLNVHEKSASISRHFLSRVQKYRKTLRVLSQCRFHLFHCSDFNLAYALGRHAKLSSQFMQGRARAVIVG